MISKNIKYYCTDYKNIENFQEALEDKTEVWHCHHRLETNFSDGTPRPRNAQLKRNELVTLGMYYNRPANELIFLTEAEHRKMHRVYNVDVDYGCCKKDPIKYTKKYNKIYYETPSGKENIYKAQHKYDKTPKRKRYQKAYQFGYKRGFPAPENIIFPKSWTEEVIDEYKRQYYNKNKGV